MLDIEVFSAYTIAEVGKTKGLVVQCMKVRDVIKIVEDDGWYQARVKGDHRQYKHPVKQGLVTIAGHFSDEVHPRTLVSIFRQAQISRPKRLREESVPFVYLESDEQSEG